MLFTPPDIRQWRTSVPGRVANKSNSADGTRFSRRLHSSDEPAVCAQRQYIRPSGDSGPIAEIAFLVRDDCPCVVVDEERGHTAWIADISFEQPLATGSSGHVDAIGGSRNGLVDNRGWTSVNLSFDDDLESERAHQFRREFLTAIPQLWNGEIIEVRLESSRKQP